MARRCSTLKRWAASLTPLPWRKSWALMPSWARNTLIGSPMVTWKRPDAESRSTSSWVAASTSPSLTPPRRGSSTSLIFPDERRNRSPGLTSLPWAAVARENASWTSVTVTRPRACSARPSTCPVLGCLISRPSRKTVSSRPGRMPSLRPLARTFEIGAVGAATPLPPDDGLEGRGARRVLHEDVHPVPEGRVLVDPDHGRDPVSQRCGLAQIAGPERPLLLVEAEELERVGDGGSGPRPSGEREP